MKVMFATIFSLAVFLFAAPTQSWASSTLVFSAGGAVPEAQVDFARQGGGRESLGSVGYASGAQYLYSVHPFLDLGIDAVYSNMKGHAFGLGPWSEGRLSPTSAVVLVLAKFHGPISDKPMPYGLFGLGVHRSSLAYTLRPTGGAVWFDTGTHEERTVIDDRGTHVAVAFGGGMDLPLNHGFFTGFEGRFEYLAPLTYRATPAGQRTGLIGIHAAQGIASLLVHIGYRFGLGAPADNRGTPPVRVSPTGPDGGLPGLL